MQKSNPGQQGRRLRKASERHFYSLYAACLHTFFAFLLTFCAFQTGLGGVSINPRLPTQPPLPLTLKHLAHTLPLLALTAVASPRFGACCPPPVAVYLYSVKGRVGFLPTGAACSLAQFSLARIKSPFLALLFFFGSLCVGLRL